MKIFRNSRYITIKLICIIILIAMPLQTWKLQAMQVSGHYDENLEIQETESFAHLSMRLVEAVREGEPNDVITTALAEVSAESLHKNLNTESEKKSFWLNIYNAYIQILLLEDPELFKRRNSLFGYNFFSSPQITIAGKKLSFDDIEHGIMRRSRMKLSMGYTRQLFVDDFIKKFWWKEIDPRIHFALNCGAASCPPVAIFDPDCIEEQLDIVTRQYLAENTDYDPEKTVSKCPG